MKVSATSPSLSQSLEFDKGWAAVLTELFKVRLTTLVVLTAGAGFYLGTTGELNYGRLLSAMFGTALLAGGAAALNQLLERNLDAKMPRTADRPLPSGRMQPGTVLAIGSSLAALGVTWLWLSANPAASVVGAVTLLSYLFVYTPLKTRSWTNTIVGAIPGALPPLIGWTAAKGGISTPGLALVLLQALWQIPHFMAIAWMYKEEYANAGFKMLSGEDEKGTRTAQLGLLFTLILIPASLAPFALGLAGTLYAVTAGVLSLSFAVAAARFARLRTISRARQLFLMSVVYLPVLMGLLVFDKN